MEPPAHPNPTCLHHRLPCHAWKHGSTCRWWLSQHIHLLHSCNTTNTSFLFLIILQNKTNRIKKGDQLANSWGQEKTLWRSRRTDGREDEEQINNQQKEIRANDVPVDGKKRRKSRRSRKRRRRSQNSLMFIRWQINEMLQQLAAAATLKIKRWFLVGD